MNTLEQAGIIARDAALAAWNRNIVEPKKPGTELASAAEVDRMIRTPAGIDWYWNQRFDADGEFEWCGAFAAFAWAHAGLDLDLRRLYYSSTGRLSAYAAYQFYFGTPNEREVCSRFLVPRKPEDRRVRIVLDENSTLDDLGAFVPRAGDILLVGTPGTRMGTHVCVVDEWDPERKGAATIEGNCRGVFPDGTDTSHVNGGAQGVTRNFRTVGRVRGQNAPHIRRIIRPALHDLTGAKA